MEYVRGEIDLFMEVGGGVEITFLPGWHETKFHLQLHGEVGCSPKKCPDSPMCSEFFAKSGESEVSGEVYFLEILREREFHFELHGEVSVFATVKSVENR